MASEGKWRFNYNRRLITAIAHHGPSFSRNSRIIRASDFESGDGIADFPADTLDTLENSSLFPPSPPSALHSLSLPLSFVHPRLTYTG